MSEGWNRILRQSPFSGQRQAEPRPDTAEVETALQECEDKGVTDRDSGRVAAYAWYSGIENDRVLKVVRAAGARNVLLRELSCYKVQGERKASELIALMVHRGSTFNLAQCLGNPAIGWAVAVMNVVEAADFSGLVSSIDSPQGDQLERTPATTATITPAIDIAIIVAGRGDRRAPANHRRRSDTGSGRQA